MKNWAKKFETALNLFENQCVALSEDNHTKVPNNLSFNIGMKIKTYIEIKNIQNIFNSIQKPVDSSGRRDLSYKQA